MIREDENTQSGEGRRRASHARWFAVNTLPYKEQGAIAHLQNQGFRTFMPRIRKTRRHARKLDTVLAPLFPRYFFISLDLDRDQWRSVNGTYGVARLVMQSDRPLPVPPGIVEDLLALADADGCVHFDRGNRFRVGQKVLIEDGPLARHFAIIDRLDGKGRVDLLLELMGRSARVRMKASALRPAG